MSYKWVAICRIIQYRQVGVLEETLNSELDIWG